MIEYRIELFIAGHLLPDPAGIVPSQKIYGAFLLMDDKNRAFSHQEFKDGLLRVLETEDIGHGFEACVFTAEDGDVSWVGVELIDVYQQPNLKDAIHIFAKDCLRIGVKDGAVELRAVYDVFVKHTVDYHGGHVRIPSMHEFNQEMYGYATRFDSSVRLVIYNNKPFWSMIELQQHCR